MGQFTELQVQVGATVGPQTLQDGAKVYGRADKQGALVTTNAHGRYTEAAYRRNIFYSHTANQATSVPEEINVGNTVWNPTGSGRVLSLLKWAISVTATSAGCLGFNLTYGVAALTPTTLTAATTGCTYLSGVTGVAKAYSTATYLAHPTPIFLLHHNTEAISLTGETYVAGDFEGGIIVPPGFYVGINAITAAGVGIYSSLWWEEIPI